MHTVKPYQTSESKRNQVQKMFDSIAGRYDMLNHILSLGVDMIWRRKLIRQLKKYKHSTILDIATGTADLAIAASCLKPDKIIGIDISEQMLKVGERKIQKLNLQNLITLQQADAEHLPFDDNSFDAVTVAFGIRNFENLEKGLKEIFRVLKKDGIVIILEFSKPVCFPVKQIYQWYSKFILPKVGKIISGDRHAYSYLPYSIKIFPEGKEMLEILSRLNFHFVKLKSMTFRIVSLYSGIKL